MTLLPRRTAAVVLLAVLAATGLAACGDDDGGSPDVRVEGAVLPAPAGANGALYLRLVNDGDGSDRLLGATTEAADGVELHETRAGDDGLSRMVPVDEVEVGPGETVTFEPGGLHVMLLGVDPLEVGDRLTVVLDLERSGDLEVEVPVGTVADALG
ncbi:copper chaperone PCu(A)C [Actinomarinicola tropica]|uniref:copper chaperone PCu(A)C n=1 Tax=Actinomarinicola tropica TaxID=2789776 RepID=UPI001899B166|nr:copper chaperone PCu(A)C [Actinomarinicola tropica]